MKGLLCTFILVIGFIMSSFGQTEVWMMSDLAYVIESPANREEIITAMQQLHSNTQVALSLTTLFEQDVYMASSQAVAAQWLAKQTYGISIFLTVTNRTKAFRQCKIQLTPATETLLSAEEIQQIRTSIMEYYFRSSPIPTNAYTSGLLGGIKAMERKILENNEKREVTNQAAIANKGADLAGEDSIALDNTNTVQALILEVLFLLEEKIGIYLKNKEKGPLDEILLKRMLALPDCLPQQEEELQEVWDKIDYFKSHTEELIALIERNKTDKERFDALVDKLTGKKPPYRGVLTEGEWDELLAIVCPYIVLQTTIKGISENPDLVAFNSVPEFFQLKDERLEFTYSLIDTLGLKHNKLKLFKIGNDEDTTLVCSYTGLTQGKKISFVDVRDQNKIGWSGKNAAGNYVSPGNYLLVMVAATDADYTNGFVDSKQLTINPFDVSAIDDVDFFGYSSSDPTGCFRRASEMLQAAGYRTVGPDHADVIQMTQADSTDSLQIQDNIQDGITLINEHLDNNIPIMVGVDYHDGHPGNSDETTDHWLVIVGRTTNNNQTCYLYYDAQTSHESVGTSIDNKLCEQNNHTLTDVYREGTTYERTYTVTMVRPSEEIND